MPFSDFDHCPVFCKRVLTFRKRTLKYLGSRSSFLQLNFQIVRPENHNMLTYVQRKPMKQMWLNDCIWCGMYRNTPCPCNFSVSQLQPISREADEGKRSRQRQSNSIDYLSSVPNTTASQQSRTGCGFIHQIQFS